MRKLIFLWLLFLALPNCSFAILSMELTRGRAGAIPIAVVPFSVQADLLPHDITQVITNDLQNSGRFKVYGKSALSKFPSDAREVSTAYFQKLGTGNVLVGKVQPKGHDHLEVTFQLMDVYRNSESNVLINKKFKITRDELRTVAHRISDLVYQKITGLKGIFSTKLAYVVVKRLSAKKSRYVLEVSDQDGYNPHPLLTSSEPIMSPAWAPNGKQIAYVSFEKKRASIFIQDVDTGSRFLLSKYPGINGAPAWSPDGKKIALVLSKSGAPNIYIMDIASRKLSQVTHDFYINTEPAWAADGHSLMFTSNRSGGPQIYQVFLEKNATSRITFDGNYNARATFARNGKNIAMIHRVSGIFNIAVLDLDAGTTHVLTPKAGDSASPSIAPNGSMILYDTVYRGRNVLAMVSVDGRVQLYLPPRDGEAQDPAWSPFLS